MGMKHFVRFGLYEIKGSINVQLAEKTGFSEEDAQVVKECLRTLFVNDASSARPDGSMEVYKLLLVGTQLQGRPVLLRQGPPVSESRAEIRGGYSLQCGGL